MGAYLLASAAGLAAFLLILLLRLPNRAWVVVLMFGATCALSLGLLAASDSDLPTILIAGVIGLLTSIPMSVAYCLISGTPWRIRGLPSGNSTGGSEVGGH